MRGEFGEMGLAAFDLGAFFVAEVVVEETAFGFDHEVKALGAVFIDEHSPVGVVGAERRGDFEPARELGIDFDGFVLL